MAQDGARERHHILLVDDEAIVGMALSDDLEDAGYRVTGPFAGSAEALAWLGSNVPDAAIIDIGLRQGSGLDVARECRRRAVPFVFFSGDDPSSYRRMAEFAVVPWVDKPATLTEILAALRSAWDGHDKTKRTLCRNGAFDRL